MAQGHGARRTQYTHDSNLVLQASTTIAASANGATILDLGGGDQDNAPLVYFDVVHDVTAIEIASGDEIYTLILEGSTSATFASGIEELGAITVGDGTTIPGNSDVDSTTGRYVMSGSNERNGRTYQYVRMRYEVAGTVATGITLESRLHMRV